MCIYIGVGYWPEYSFKSTLIALAISQSLALFFEQINDLKYTNTKSILLK